MATAGRILIIPKGNWDAATTYENLDLVAHNGGAWLAKKPSVGIEPSEANAEYWHDFLGEVLTAESIGALSIEGGTLSGDVTFSENTGIRMLPVSSGGSLGSLMFQNPSNTETLGRVFGMFVDGVLSRIGIGVGSDGYLVEKSFSVYADSVKFKDKNLYGEHNKPSGSYVGNGSATERTINTGGGIGHTLEIHGNGYKCYVSNMGAVCLKSDGTLTGISYEKVRYRFQDGILTITTSESCLNANGVEYWYKLT